MSKRFIAIQARQEAAEALLRAGSTSNITLVGPTIIASATAPTKVEGRVEYDQAGDPQVQPYKRTFTDQTSLQIGAAGGTFSLVFPLGDIPIPDEASLRLHLIVSQRQVFAGAGAPISASWEMLAGFARRNAGAPLATQSPNPTITDASGTNGGAPPVAFTAPTVIAVNTIGTTWVAQIQVTGVVGQVIDSSVIVEWQIST